MQLSREEKTNTHILTEEQQAIIRSAGNIKINAVAGSGKTTTIIQYAANRPKESRILYLAFNKSVRLEAKKRFEALGLHNVQVETAHSLAYKHIVINSHYTVCTKTYTTYEIAGMLGLQATGEKHSEFILANHISKFIAFFCNSSAKKVQDLHYLDLVTDEKAKTFVANHYPLIEQGTRLFLSKMYKGEIAITHDFYLKLFQLSNPTLHCDYILFDEGQDASPAMLDIFLRQKATRVIVGDTHQQIYAWRHAVNSLDKVSAIIYQLSTSFRFHQDIANLATAVLLWKNHLQPTQPVAISGKGTPSITNSKATIARTNLGLLLRAITFITEHKDVNHLYFEGNLNSYTYADDGASLYDVLNLYNTQHARIRDKLIGAMSNLAELEEYIEKTEDVQLAMMVEIVKEYGNEIPSLIQSLKSKHVGDEDKAKAEMIFSTVHRSKGMEYDAVQLVDDFVTEAKLEKLSTEKKENNEINNAKWNEEINLLYVAITRTKGTLRIPETLLPKDFPKSLYIQIIPVKKEGDGKNVGFANSNITRYKTKHTNNQLQKVSSSPSYTEKRLQYKNAYERWNKQSDEELREMYVNGTDLITMTDYFGRKKGEIVLRLKKLGYEPYER